DISLGLDLFHINTKQQGDVWQFQLPIFNNLTYTLPISSTRILLNSEWGFRPVFHYVFPFIEAGIGFAINEASYNDAPKPGTTAMPLHLNHHTQGQFSYSIGGGFRIPVRKNMEASLRFIYTDLGHAKTTNTGSITIAAPVSVALTTQTWVLGFTYLFQ
ncbi:MAG: outer membrane beta-barrel protein, partial [Coxiellaceae bacterium]|nr:outer membrane beta-barrel protein [Coxiellaceae bacterium]